MGAPLDLDQLSASGVLSRPGLARAREGASLGPERIDGDISVGDLVSRRFGQEVTDRLVEPLLGGVYAGHARGRSARATVPQLVGLAERGSVLAQAQEIPTIQDVPVFAGIAGGLGRLPDVLVGSGRFAVRTDVTVRELRQVASGFVFVPRRIDARPKAVVGGPGRPGDARDAHVEAACRADPVRERGPGRDRVRLDGDRDDGVSGVLRGRACRDRVLRFPGAADRRSPDQGGHVLFAKWDWVREAGREDDLLVMRASLGRHREESSLQRTDQELVEVSLADLALATGVTAVPVDVHVQRWGGGLPQYAVGHLDRVARIRAGVRRIAGIGGVRGRLRRRGHPRRHRLGPPCRHRGHRGTMTL